MILKGVPERTKKKIVLLGKDYKKRLLAYMDPSSVDRIMKYRNLEDENDNPLKKDGLKMKKGITQFVPVQAKPGSTINWTFTV